MPQIRCVTAHSYSDGVPATFADESPVALTRRARRINRELAELYPDAHATVDALRDAGVKLALITNGAAEEQRPKVTRFALAERFDHIQIEGEHGFGKPEERAYVHALAALGVAAKDAWIVGDNLDWEVIAPQRLGIHAIWYDPHGDGVPQGHAARPDRIIRRLSELVENPTLPQGAGRFTLPHAPAALRRR